MTPPPELVGVAILAVLWLPLWWLAGGRRPLTWRAPLTVAAAAGIMAVDQGDLLAMTAALAWTWCAARRWHTHRAPHLDEVWSNEPFTDKANTPGPGTPTLDLLETCHGPGGPPLTALRRRRHTTTRSRGPR